MPACYTEQVEDPLVCTCLYVSEREVVEAIRDGADSVEAVGHACEAGTCCQSCQPTIKMLLEEETRRQLKRSAGKGALHQLSLFPGVAGSTKATAPMGAHARGPKKP